MFPPLPLSLSILLKELLNVQIILSLRDSVGTRKGSTIITEINRYHKLQLQLKYDSGTTRVSNTNKWNHPSRIHCPLKMSRGHRDTSEPMIDGEPRLHGGFGLWSDCSQFGYSVHRWHLFSPYTREPVHLPNRKSSSYPSNRHHYLPSVPCVCVSVHCPYPPPSNVFSGRLPKIKRSLTFTPSPLFLFVNFVILNYL